jgi:hypothetical protein
MNLKSFKKFISKGRVLAGNRVPDSNFLEGLIRKHPIGFAAGVIPPALYGLYSFIQTMNGNKDELYNRFPVRKPETLDISTDLVSFFDNYQDRYLGKK